MQLKLSQKNSRYDLLAKEMRTAESFAHMDEEKARLVFNLGKDSKDWKIKLAQKDLLNSGLNKSNITPILCRPFDIRYTYYTGESSGFHCRPRGEVMRHMLRENIGLITNKEVNGKFQHVLCSNLLINDCTVSSMTKERSYYFPLFLYPSLFPEDESGLSVNIPEKIINAIFPSPPTPLPEGEGLRVRAESIFCYIYAILYSTIYREKYAEFLKTDFPRVPFTEDNDLFMEMAQLGKRLASLHLMKSPELEDTFSRFEAAGSNLVQKVVFVMPLGSGAESGKKKRGKGVHDKIGKVFINDSQYFSDIPEQVWEYQIGGYQVMEKWLKDRKGRRLSNEDIHHYMKVASALQFTIDIQKEIDELYPQVEKSLITI